jgi:hypothetical protein
MTEMSVIQRALADCWAVEVAGLAYYEALAERFAEHRGEANVLALVEKTTRDLIEPLARTHEVSIDHEAAGRGGYNAAQSASDWREAMENNLVFAPGTLQMFENLASALPENESALGEAVVEHERAQIAFFESVVAGESGDLSALHAYLERHGASRSS